MTLAERLSARLTATAREQPPLVGDARHSAGVGIRAAVLIAITDRPAPGAILTQRPDTMRRHPGQVAFPGGRVDPDDVDAVAAALREAEEEVALAPQAVSVVATLPPYRTITGYDVTPVIGVVPPDLRLVPHDREVAAVFEVPLAFLFDPDNRTDRTALVDGIERHYIEIVWNDRRIWGATAAMLVNLAARLQ